MNIILASIFVLSSILTPLAPVNDKDPGPAISNTIDCQPHKIDGFQLPAWVTNETWYTPMPAHTSGNAVWYAPWMMEGTANYRGMDLTNFMGGIATTSAGDIGKTAWLKRDGMEWEGPYLIVDVSQRNHAYYHATIVGSIFEVDYPTALRWGIVSSSNNKKGYVVNQWLMPNVEMTIGLRPPSIESTPINYKEWYIENADFCDGEYNRAWKVQDWMIMSYSDYEIAYEESEIEVSLNTPAPNIANIPVPGSTINDADDILPLSCSEEVANLQLQINELQIKLDNNRSIITILSIGPFHAAISYFPQETP